MTANIGQAVTDKGVCAKTRFPLVTPILTLLAVVATVIGGDALELRRGGEAWRILTCHLTHFSYEQLAWNALAFLALGLVCERRSRVAFHATLLASALLVPIAVLAIAPGVTAYRGLSGIASALFVLLLIQERRSRLAVLCGVAFLAKITFELVAGSAVFVSYSGKGLVPVPIAHVAGAVAAALALWLAATAPALRRRAALLLPLLFVSCISLQGPAPQATLPVNACASRGLNGVWTSQHTTLFGPTWQKLVLHSDCRYYVRYQLLFIRIRATGTYSVDENTIRVNEKTLPFRLEGKRLLVEENGELIPYTRR